MNPYFNYNATQIQQSGGSSYFSVVYPRLKLAILGFASTLIFYTTLCSTFIHFKMNDNYFLLLPLSLSLCLISIFSCILVLSDKSRFRFSSADFLFIIIVGYYAIRYNYQLLLANWKIIYAFLLLILWFSTRIIFSGTLNLKPLFAVSMITVGATLAIWGLLQLYGFQQSNHNLFTITGPFYNPGPYSGYIAMIIPLCLDRVLVSKGVLRSFYSIALFLMLCIIPAGMSRSAWLAILVSCLWVLMVRLHWANKIKLYRKRHPNIFDLYVGLFLAVLLMVLFFFFNMKSDSANGRLFIWKNTITAILKQPILGYGAGSFPAVYGQAQANYFASGNYSEIEERVAGSPEYAFNECLQMSIEGGILLLALFLSFSVLVLKKGIQIKEYGTCAALLSLFIFSLSSYPSNVVSFGIAGIFLISHCISIQDTRQLLDKKRIFTTILLSLITLLGSLSTTHSLRELKALSDRWYYTDALYFSKEIDAATLGYNRLYNKLQHNPNYLLNYAKCLSAQQHIHEANKILERMLLVSNNPLSYNIQGKNHEKLKDFSTAEDCYKSATHLLPGRIHPYYLLAKLYANPDFFDNRKMHEMVTIVLTKKPKIHSKAVDEMRSEMEELLYTQTIN